MYFACLSRISHNRALSWWDIPEISKQDSDKFRRSNKHNKNINCMFYSENWPFLVLKYFDWSLWRDGGTSQDTKMLTSSLTRVWKVAKLFSYTVITQINGSEAKSNDFIWFKKKLSPTIANGTKPTGLTQTAVRSFCNRQG